MLTHTHSHSLHPLVASLCYKSLSSVLFWGGGYFAQRRNYNGFPNPFSLLNYSDVTKPHYACKCSQLAEFSSCVFVRVCVCVYCPYSLYGFMLCDQLKICLRVCTGKCKSQQLCTCVYLL